MKYTLLLAQLFIQWSVFAQPTIIPGAQPHQLLTNLYPCPVQTSADGKLVAIGGDGDYNIIDVEVGTIQKLELYIKGKSLLSPNFESAFNFSCCYTSAGGPGVGSKNFWSAYGSVTKEPSFVYKDSLVVIGASKTGEVYVSSTWKQDIYFHGNKKTGIGGYVGLWTANPKTGKLLKQLRHDTLVYNNWNREDFYPNLKITPNALIILDEREKIKALRILPFESDAVFIRYTNYDGPIEADDNFLYVYNYNYVLDVTDLQTGETSLQIVNSNSNTGYKDICNDCGYFLFADNAIYRFNSVTGAVYKFTIENKMLKTAGNWNVPIGIDGINMVKGQAYDIRIVKGPSLLVMPVWYKQNDFDPGNEAFLVDLPTQTLKFKIAPFFHLDPAIKAYNASVREQDLQAERDRETAKKLAEQKKEMECENYFKKSGHIKGRTYMHNNELLIMAGYDCEEKTYILWRPMQGTDPSYGTIIKKVKYNPAFGDKFMEARQQYYTCTECDGDGTVAVTKYTTKTKELPWGYFSGIETRKITTTATTTAESCPKCNGRGVILK